MKVAVLNLLNLFIAACYCCTEKTPGNACRTTPLEHGSVNYTCAVRHNVSGCCPNGICVRGTAVAYGCDNGYKRQGVKKMKCKATGFARQPPVCAKITCKGPNGKIANIGDAIKPTCGNGLKISDNITDKTVVCQSDGTWSRPIRQHCQEIRCPSAPSINGAEYIGIRGKHSENSTAFYLCKRNSFTLTCKNGIWVGDQDYCRNRRILKPAVCIVEDLLRNYSGTVDMHVIVRGKRARASRRVNVGKKATFACKDPRKTLNVKCEAICTARGTWTLNQNKNPECQ
eukprot:m.12866 g.12866  ORF g.12866 m.12866 type:complete len:285 (+) comp24348_c0_seq1:125-979(+)